MNESTTKNLNKTIEFKPKSRTNASENEKNANISHTISAEPFTYKVKKEAIEKHSRMMSMDSAAPNSPVDFQSQNLSSGVNIFRQNYHHHGVQNLTGNPNLGSHPNQGLGNQGNQNLTGNHGYQNSYQNSHHNSSNHSNFSNQQQFSQQMNSESQFYQPAWMPTGTDKCQYLKQLLQDKKHLMNIMCLSPIGFHHLDKLLEHEIVKVRSVLFQNNDRAAMALPEAEGPTIIKTHKVWVPIKENPEYNFVGRILGPRGLTAKQLEQETQCKIMVRGRGSMRDKKKEDMNRGKQNWEHLNEDLHVLITVEDTENRANVKIQRAVDEINKLLIPQQDGEDDLKKKQLMELAIINGTYRDNSTPAKNPRLINNQLPSINQTAMSIGAQSAVSTVGGLTQSVQSGFISPQNSVNLGNYNFNGNQVQIGRNNNLVPPQAQMGVQQAQQQQHQAQQAQQQLLGFAPVVASGPQFVRAYNVAPASINSPGQENSQISGGASQAPTVYYQTTDQPQFAYATNFVPAAFYQAGTTIDQSYINHGLVQQQANAAVQAQVASAATAVAGQQASAGKKTENLEQNDPKDAMVN